MIDLISEAAGGRVVECSDEYFAPASNLIKVAAPVRGEERYTERGKWMDGWETRRRRQPGHDWCVLSLGVPGRIRRLGVDTSHFTGNFPHQFSLEACGVGSDHRLDEALWVEIVPPTELSGDTIATFEVDDPHRVTHVRFNIFPDGGVARLRVEGDPIPSMREVCPDSLTDLMSVLVGGMVLEASDMHYSHPSNVLKATPPAGMWDGWETRRRRGPGYDWASFRLGLRGQVEMVVVDTSHFKGNAPGAVSLELSDDGSEWRQVLDRVAIEADRPNDIGLSEPDDASFVRLAIHPDGGVARLRVYGRPHLEAAGERRVEYLNSLFGQEVWRFLHMACASTVWIEAMLAERPFQSVQAVLAAAEVAFAGLDEPDWLEAFAGHPRIGDRGDDVSNSEQAAAMDAPSSVQVELAQLNAEHEERFGFTFIVYATGKTADEILAAARARSNNSREEEIANSAKEQRRITETRLLRMLCQERA